MPFVCPPDCGHCCSHLEREPVPGDEEFRDVLREHGIYHCRDAPRVGLSLSGAEAATLRARAAARKLRVDIHPRTFLLESRRRIAVVLDWHMPEASCPFLDGYACTVYDARPLVCRAYPVMGLGRGASGLAPECPKMPLPLVQLRGERKARRAIDEAHAKLDEIGSALLVAQGARFVSGLSAREAAARLKRYRIASPEEFLSRPPRTR